MKKWSIVAVGALLAAGPGMGSNSEEPSILFVPELQKVSRCAIDLTYLGELHQRGFAVDYLNHISEINWERIRQYDCLVVYDVPYPADHTEGRSDGPHRDEVIALINRYIEAGGGVLLIKPNYHADENIRPLLAKWNARIPYEVLRQDVNRVQFPRMNLDSVSLAWTDDVNKETAVSDSVDRIYYPLKDHYDGCETSAIWVGKEWDIVYRAPDGAVSVPFEEQEGTKQYFPRPKDPLVREQPVESPPLFAIRRFGKGRIALTSTWPTWSIGSGTTWLYNRHILTRGWDGVASDFQKLLDNTYRWLAEPGDGGSTVGGYVQDPARLLAPNSQDDVRREFAEGVPDPEQYVEQAESSNVVKGIYGPKSNYGGGSGTVEEWANVARDAGLGFVVFMDDFEKLTTLTFEELKADCLKYSSSELSLIPGYVMDTTIGDHFFAYGPGDFLEFPPDECLAGEDKTLFNIQYQDAEGRFAKGNACLNWIVRAKNRNMNFGYYSFNDGGGTMRMYDMRVYSAAAIRTYENGRLMEDVTDDFLTTVAATISPLPVTVHILHAPADLAAQAGRDITHTYCLADGAGTVFEDALHYAHQYSGSAVFSSSGPIVRSWMNCIRPATYASARFAPGLTFAPAFLWVQSDVGLKSIELYDGPRLFRRFTFQGEKEVRRILQLSSTLHRNVVLIAEDLRGGRAVTFPLRIYKPNTSASFCSDHVNDCGNTYLGRGTGITQMFRAPDAWGGLSWDGGPQGKVNIFPHGIITPHIKSNLGMEGDRHFANVPYLIFADEAGNGFRSHRSRVYDHRVQVINPWYTFGPILDSKLIDVDVRYGEWHRASLRPRETGWAPQSIRTGALPTLFEMDIVSKKDQAVESIQLAHSPWIRSQRTLMLLWGRNGNSEPCRKIQVFPPTENSINEHTIDRGDWAGLYSPQTSCGIVWYNRGAPLQFRINTTPDGVAYMLLFHALPDDAEFERGRALHYELFSLVYPIDVSEQGLERFEKTVAYFRELDGVEILEGTRRGNGGPIDIAAGNYRVHLKSGKPSWDLATALPVRVLGLNPNWSAGYYQLTGYAQGTYGDGTRKYHPCGFDLQGRVRATLYHCLAEKTEAIIGHPVVCDSPGLIVQVTQKPTGDGGYSYYVAVSNPTDKPIQTTLRKNISLPDFPFESTELTVPPGGYRIASDG